MQRLLTTVLILPCLTLGGIIPLYAAGYPMPPDGEDLVGQIQKVTARKEDTLLDIARRHDLGYEEMILANPGVDVWLPGEGTIVTLPTLFILPKAPRRGIIVNLAEMRLYYYPEPGSEAEENRRVISYPISVGRVDWETPTVSSRITGKRINPVWHPPASILNEHAEHGKPLPKAVPPGPQNPLGHFALYLDLPEYLIHGTNRPYGIGMRVTHGCIRLYPEDIKAMFENVPLGTPVRIINQPAKAGWHNGLLYLEVHPTPDGKPRSMTSLVKAIIEATKSRPDYRIDWEKVRHLASQPGGIPLPIGKDIPARPSLSEQIGKKEKP
jgi:L,D-transpeptidase ErfK/SrfK